MRAPLDARLPDEGDNPMTRPSAFPSTFRRARIAPALDERRRERLWRRFQAVARLSPLELALLALALRDLSAPGTAPRRFSLQLAAHEADRLVWSGAGPDWDGVRPCSEEVAVSAFRAYMAALAALPLALTAPAADPTEATVAARRALWAFWCAFAGCALAQATPPGATA